MQKYFIITRETSKIKYAKSIYDITEQNANIINEKNQIVRGDDNIFLEKYIEKNTLCKKIYIAENNKEAQKQKSKNCVELKNIKTNETLINKFL